MQSQEDEPIEEVSEIFFNYFNACYQRVPFDQFVYDCYQIFSRGFRLCRGTFSSTIGTNCAVGTNGLPLNHWYSLLMYIS